MKIHKYKESFRDITLIIINSTYAWTKINNNSIIFICDYFKSYEDCFKFSIDSEEIR